ncbi:hypothetical protein FGO68_gene389 [Halteria grandinella]|uniref:Uncharacterized protein n=1 Tax=Halteria grandinella TaxID=5974 RepID=A0A8J8SVD0_HALGN|nr:hypothetical protein FGO68_gene389 [Halteria grandinella]
MNIPKCGKLLWPSIQRDKKQAYQWHLQQQHLEKSDYQGISMVIKRGKSEQPEAESHIQTLQIFLASFLYLTQDLRGSMSPQHGPRS